jgi:membrane associated rhomboid family serine protease
MVVFPIRDNIPARTFPYVNYALIAVCGLVFLLQLRSDEAGQKIVEQYGMIPARVTNPDQAVMIREMVAVQTPLGLEAREREHPATEPPIPAWLTLVTCIFLHGGWMHILGNMWFLHIFGDNVEDRLGHFLYLIFYLATGIAASLVHLVSGPESTIPTVGASGAIAGVMGGYFVLYPHSRVLTMVPIVIFIQIVVLPAPLFLGVWFLLQFFQGSFSIDGVEAGGVAWWAHVGGFVAGVALVLVDRALGLTSPPVERRLPHTESPFGTYRFQRKWDDHAGY